MYNRPSLKKPHYRGDLISGFLIFILHSLVQTFKWPNSYSSGIQSKECNSIMGEGIHGSRMDIPGPPPAYEYPWIVRIDLCIHQVGENYVDYYTSHVYEISMN